MCLVVNLIISSRIFFFAWLWRRNVNLFLTSVVPFSWRAIVDWSRLCCWTSIGRFRSMITLQSAFVNSRNHFASVIVATDWRYLLCLAGRFSDFEFYGSMEKSLAFWLQRLFFTVLFASTPCDLRELVSCDWKCLTPSAEIWAVSVLSFDDFVFQNMLATVWVVLQFQEIFLRAFKRISSCHLN